MPKITFLSGSVPLTKSFALDPDNKLIKYPYPHLANFTSETLELKNIGALHDALIPRALSGACLLKGAIQRPLINESRAGSTNSGTPTRWICYDLDGAPFKTPQEFLDTIGMGGISYVVQYSASAGMPGSMGLSCHIFQYLSRELPAPQLKAWLTYLNLHTPALTAAITLSRTGSSLHWPLDVTACQNDKLLYIAPPQLGKGLKPALKDSQRIVLVKKPLVELPVERIALHAPAELQKTARTLLNSLRKAAKLDPIRHKTVFQGEYEVQPQPGEFAVTGMKEDRGFRYFNFNGGDSWGYYQPIDNPELVHNFKGEPAYRLKDIAPEVYKDLTRAQNIQNATPNEQGDLLLAFRDKRTAVYWKGTWNPGTQILDIHAVKSELQLDHFLRGHGRVLGDFVPEWELVFDPRSDVVVDEEKHIVNTFIPSSYMRGEKPANTDYPIIQRILDSAVGVGEIQEHFLNALAVVFQLRQKPLTAFVLHGTEGTGKGLLAHRILRPLFGSQYVVMKRAGELRDNFNGWLESALIAIIDEIDVDIFTDKRNVEGDLRNMITEPIVSIRRMRTNSYEVQNFTFFLFYSNRPQPVHVPLGDRRFNVGQFQNTRLLLDDKDFARIEDELYAFAWYLRTRKADPQQARMVLQTSDRALVQDLGITSVDETAQAILKGDLNQLVSAMPDEKLLASLNAVDMTASAYSTLIKRFITEGVSKISRDELKVIFTHCVGQVPMGANKFTSYLRHHNIYTKRLRIGNDLHYGIEIEWKIPQEERAALNTAFNQPKLKTLKKSA